MSQQFLPDSSDLTYLFEKQGLSCVLVKPGSHNTRMQAVCLALGFTEIDREDVKEVLSKPFQGLQSITYRMTSQEWKNLQTDMEGNY